MLQDGSYQRRISMETLLTRISLELHLLGTSIGGVELAVQHLAARTSEVDTGAIRDLQNIDLIGQTVQNLAEFIACLAREVPADWPIGIEPALRSISLQAVANRLVMPADAPAPEAHHQPGDFDSF